MARLTRSHSIESAVSLLPLFICPISALFSDSGFVGGALILVAAISCGLIFVFKRDRVASTLHKGWPFVLLTAIYASSSIITPSFEGTKHLLSTLSITLFFLYYTQNGAEIVRNPIFLMGCFLASIAFVIPSILEINQKNFDGGMAFYGVCIFVYLWLGNRSPQNIRCRSIVLLFGLGASVYGYIINFRMLVIYGLMLAVSYLVFSWRPRLTKAYKAQFIFLFLFIFSFVFFYANIESFSYLSAVNDFLVRTTERSALSGRQILWPVIIESIINHPILGLGAGTLPSDVMDTDLSSHNFYLQIALQVGLVGLFFVMSAIYVVWRALARVEIKNASSVFALCILLVFILHNASEVLMFQNALRVSIPAWVIIFVAISKAERVATRNG